jgi:hypothetical protein
MAPRNKRPTQDEYIEPEDYVVGWTQHDNNGHIVNHGHGEPLSRAEAERAKRAINKEDPHLRGHIVRRRP